MKIYTKNGDTGHSSIIGKVNIPKSNTLFEAIGAIDELNSLVGVSICYIKDRKIKKDLFFIQNHLFLIGAVLSSTKNNPTYEKMITQYTKFLEEKIDEMEKTLPTLKNFILPGGSVSSSFIHLARSVTRRCERNLVNSKSPKYILPYINRLSDYFFVLARFLNKKTKTKEVVWKINNS